MAVEHLVRDLRFGARLMVRSPGFTAVAVLSLALGIGASSAIFSLINAIVLRPLPVADPQQLFLAQATERDDVNPRFSFPAVARFGEMLEGRAEVAALTSAEPVRFETRVGNEVARPADPARLQLVSGDFFGTLRQRAQIGRLLIPDDLQMPGKPFAVISDGFWNRRFGRTPRVLETELIVNGTAMAIVGVAAPEFFGATVGDAQTPDIWAPAALQSLLRFSGDFRRTGGNVQKPWPFEPEVMWLQVMIRVPPAHAPAAADAMTIALSRETPRKSGQDAGAMRVTLLPGAGGFSSMRTELTAPLIVLLLAVGLLLAIACANIGSLLLARAAMRTREMAVRLSMGAGRGRLIRQLLTESLLLGAMGCVLGLALAYWSSAALLTFLTRGRTVTGVDVTPDWRVIVVALVTSLVAALAFGLLPALRGTGVSPAGSLKSNTRSVIGGHGGRLPAGKLLIAGQMAVSILLLLVAALFARSLQALTNIDVGYDSAHLLVARIDARSSGYTVSELPVLYPRIVERLGGLPGVRAVSLAANGSFSGSRNRGDFQLEGYTPARNEPMVTLKDWVTADYFGTVGLAIKQGRGFGPQDTDSSQRVCVISEAMARRYFRVQNPLGKRWATGGNFSRDGYEIVGVVEDARYNDLRAESLNMVYMPATQTEQYLRVVTVRAAGNPTSLTETVRQALREEEPRLIVSTIDTLDSRIARSIGIERLLGWLTMTFSVVALGLACLGLYGTISHAVKRRTAELGLRMALGADRASVQWLIVREAFVLVLVGGAIRLPFAFMAARAVQSFLYATAPSDPVAYGVAAGVLALVCGVAAYIPAWRASRLDPVVALRTE